MLSERAYIVTGGSAGFGYTIARCLIDAGARVGITGRNQERLDKADAELGEHCVAYVADVADSAAVTAAFTAIKAHFGRLDGLVNNAGLAYPNAIECLVEAEVVTQINTNFLGTVLCCQAAIPLLRGGDNPRIINISSASAWHYDEMSHLSIYAASKAAVERFSRDLYLELQADGIAVTCLRPGGAWTTFSDGWDPKAIERGFAAWADRGKYMSTGMEVEQVADAVVYARRLTEGVAVDLLELRPNIPTPKN